MAHPLYSGNDCYSDIAAYTTGSFYDAMTDSAIYCIDKVLGQYWKEQNSVLTLADFGTGDGVNFLKLLKDIVRHIDTKSENSLQILAYLEDQPNNDFTLLQSKYTSTMSNTLDKNVFYATIGKTMYSQCLPAESVDIVFSSAALHWLSKIPCDIKNGLATIHADVHERALFRQQAREDWKKFLFARGTELKTGGYMVMTIFTMQEEDGLRKTMIYASEAWRKMFFQGKISKDEFEKTTLGFYVQRTEEDIRQPFSDPDIQSHGLRIVSLKSRKHDFVPLQNILENNDKYVYAAAAVDSIRSFMRHIIYYGLAKDRTTDQKNKIVEHFFSIMTDIFKEGNDFLIMKEVVVTKESSD